MRNSLILAALLALMPLPAIASSMMECRVVAIVTPADNMPGQYQINVKKARATQGGNGLLGNSCAAAKSGTAEVEGRNIPLNQEITLTFTSYSAMTPNGAMSGTRWVYAP